jgi:hypothetical protein
MPYSGVLSMLHLSRTADDSTGRAEGPFWDLGGHQRLAASVAMTCRGTRPAAPWLEDGNEH